MLGLPSPFFSPLAAAWCRAASLSGWSDVPFRQDRGRVGHRCLGQRKGLPRASCFEV
jgi:hypothetical protein